MKSKLDFTAVDPTLGFSLAASATATSYVAGQGLRLLKTMWPWQSLRGPGARNCSSTSRLLCAACSPHGRRVLSNCRGAPVRSDDLQLTLDNVSALYRQRLARPCFGTERPRVPAAKAMRRAPSFRATRSGGGVRSGGGSERRAPAHPLHPDGASNDHGRTGSARAQADRHRKRLHSRYARTSPRSRPPSPPRTDGRLDRSGAYGPRLRRL